MQIKGAVNFEQKIYMFIVTVATRLLNCSRVSYFQIQIEALNNNPGPITKLNLIIYF
jgi:hypothetical protein